jgi:hypothetical protein
MRINFQLLAFILLVVLMFFITRSNVNNQTRDLYRSEIAACNRNNNLRRESNRRIPAHLAQRDVTRSFLVSAEIARRATYKMNHAKSELIAANQFGQQVRILDQKVKFSSLPIINCTQVIKRP